MTKASRQEQYLMQYAAILSGYTVGQRRESGELITRMENNENIIAADETAFSVRAATDQLIADMRGDTESEYSIELAENSLREATRLRMEAQPIDQKMRMEINQQIDWLRGHGVVFWAGSRGYIAITAYKIHFTDTTYELPNDFIAMLRGKS